MYRQPRSPNSRSFGRLGGYSPTQHGMGAMGPIPSGGYQQSGGVQRPQQSQQSQGPTYGGINPGQLMGQGLNMLQNIPQLQTPTPSPPHALPAPMPLGQVANTTLPFPQMPSYGIPQPGAAPAFPAGGQMPGSNINLGDLRPAPFQITSGITPPSPPTRPGAPGVGSIPTKTNMLGMAQTAQQLAPALVAPQQMAQLGQWYQGAADLANQAQEARADSGVAMANFGSQANQGLRDLQARRQQQALGWLAQILGIG